MYSLLVASGLILAAQVGGEPGSPPKSKAGPPAAKAASEAGAAASDLMKEYLALRVKTPPTAAGQWKLGLWCEQRGLAGAAAVHFAEVVRLDPSREAAHRKLGHRKVGGRWLSPEAIAAAEEQKAADRLWAGRLRRIHKDIHGRNGREKQAAAQAALDAITDPKAVLPLYREFGSEPKDQVMLVQVLGQIDRPMSSKVLAMLAVYGKSPTARQRAAESLRPRSSADFMDLLVGLLVDPIAYEVRRVGGPGSPGAIFVAGERFDTARLYAPPAAPNIPFGPGDIITYDSSGMPVVQHRIGSFSATTSPKGVPGSKTLVAQTTVENSYYETYSVAQIQAEALRGAALAQAQLERDEESLKAVNANIRHFNDTVMNVAKDATGEDHGPAPKEWRKAVNGRRQSPEAPSTPAPKPVVTEVADLDYNPIFGPSGMAAQTVVSTSVYVDT
ncbi:hypothetical protein OJF2_26390 [Aquisphaera giovannonii]|uniref:Tetratricopeptide repeat protein n=1 Tax=Aquisphaera giovannonii TaxID=406548 RepID=A0A5B9W268_9BACT|nr:hypothetical protein [Aquisphaera giovannonii]QEH34105.1 hypothetical protein OJF2_26390 [Aquisphaera giovannonii]